MLKRSLCLLLVVTLLYGCSATSHPAEPVKAPAVIVAEEPKPAPETKTEQSEPPAMTKAAEPAAPAPAPEPTTTTIPTIEPEAQPTKEPTSTPAPAPESTPAPPPATASTLTEKDRQLGPVRLGQTYTELATLYPKQTANGPYPEPDVPGMVLYFDANDQVETLFFDRSSSIDKVTPRGLHEGDTLAKAIELYGAPSLSYETRHFPSSPTYSMIHLWNGSGFQIAVATHRNEPGSVITSIGLYTGRPLPPASTK